MPFGPLRRVESRGLRPRVLATLALAVVVLCAGGASGAAPLLSKSDGFQLASPPSGADTVFHDNPIGACDTGTVTQSLTAADPSYLGSSFSSGAAKSGSVFDGSHTGNSLVDGGTGAAGGVVHAVYDAGHALYTLGKGVYIGSDGRPLYRQHRGTRAG